MSFYTISDRCVPFSLTGTATDLLAIAHWVLTAFKKHPVDYPSLVCIIQRGSCCVQAGTAEAWAL